MQSTFSRARQSSTTFAPVVSALAGVPAAGGSDDPRTSRANQLHQQASHTAARRLDQHPLPGKDPGPLNQAQENMVDLEGNKPQSHAANRGLRRQEGQQARAKIVQGSPAPLPIAFAVVFNVHRNGATYRVDIGAATGAVLGAEEVH